MPTTALPTETAELTRRRFTVDEFYAMAEAGILAEDERVELLNGEIFAMAPMGAAHADINDLFDDFFKSSLRDRARVPVQGPLRVDDNTLLFPDLSVLRLRPDYRRHLPEPEDVLLLIEVSDSTLRRDREAKLPRFAAAGIPEVWIATCLPATSKPSPTPWMASIRAAASSPPTAKSAPSPFPTLC